MGELFGLLDWEDLLLPMMKLEGEKCSCKLPL